MCVSRVVSLAVSILLWSSITSAKIVEPVVMLKDINVAENVAQGLMPESMTVVGSLAYFSGYTTVHGKELWAYDGSAEPYLVADINPWGDSNPRALTAFNGELYFVADNPAYGAELWRSDGTASGTVLVRDVFPGERDGIRLDHLVVVNNQLYFVGNDLVAGSQLWVSDGSEAGTVQHAGVKPNPSGLYPPLNLSEFGGDKLIFSANDGTGYEPWVLVVGEAIEGSIGGGDFLSAEALPPKFYTELNGLVYFVVNDGSGDELWVYDDAATPKISSINGSTFSNAHDLTVVQDKLYFLANEEGQGHSLWQYDPTLSTPIVTSLVSVSPAAETLLGLSVVADELSFFAVDSLGNTGLWLAAPSGLNTRKIADLGNLDNESLPDVAMLDGVIYFSNHAAGVDSELYVSDGSAGNVSLFENLNLAGSSTPMGFVHFNGGLIFSAEDYINGRELWRTDGVSAIRVSDTVVPGESAPYGFRSFGEAEDERLYFSAGDSLKGVELWTSAATEASTQNVVNANISGSSSPSYLAAFDEDYAFIADGEAGFELWVNKRGVIRKVIDVVNESKAAIEMVTLDKRVYFVGYDEDFGYELWRSNGSLDRTSVLKDINLAGDSHPQGVISVKDARNVSVYFTAEDGNHGRELWMSDGTAGGTVMVVDLNPDGGSEPYGMTVMGEHVYYVADNGRFGAELWRSTLGRQNAEMVADIRLLGHSYPQHLTVMGDELFFVADNGYFGRELWKTDGTEAGTVLVKDINPGGHGTEMSDFAAIGDELYFSAGDDEFGLELWVSDGTEEGTVMLADINPSGSSNPTDFVRLGDYVYFSAFDANVGRELWRTNGEVDGTALVKDIHPAGSSDPRDLYVLRDKLYFSASDGEHGRELWMLDGGGIFIESTTEGGGDSFGIGAMSYLWLIVLMLGGMVRCRRTALA